MFTLHPGSRLLARDVLISHAHRGVRRTVDTDRSFTKTHSKSFHEPEGRGVTGVDTLPRKSFVRGVIIITISSQGGINPTPSTEWLNTPSPGGYCRRRGQRRPGGSPLPLSESEVHDDSNLVSLTLLRVRTFSLSSPSSTRHDPGAVGVRK